ETRRKFLYLKGVNGLSLTQPLVLVLLPCFSITPASLLLFTAINTIGFLLLSITLA
ncbi:hypothetical protein SOVF_201760, partial [Spinacia oleracea]